jgi:LysM repeat protein
MRTHKVKRGDNPTSIARQYGVTVPKLLAANPGLKPARMQIGDELKIPPRN